MTAVIRLTEASRAALTMINSSIRFSPIGVAAVWTMNMSVPRTESSKRKYGDPSAKTSVDACEVDADLTGDPLGQLGVRAGHDGEPLLRRQRLGAAELELRSRRVPASLEAGRHLLNRAAFHLVLPW